VALKKREILAVAPEAVADRCAGNYSPVQKVE
jgi:hypothetical protein